LSGLEAYFYGLLFTFGKFLADVYLPSLIESLSILLEAELLKNAFLLILA